MTGVQTCALPIYIERFYTQQSEAAQLRYSLAAERAALESFLERITAFAVTVPDLDARMNAIKSRLSIVDGWFSAAPPTDVGPVAPGILAPVASEVTSVGAVTPAGAAP